MMKLSSCIYHISTNLSLKFHGYTAQSLRVMTLGINVYQVQINHEPIKLGPPFLFRHILLIRHTYV